MWKLKLKKSLRRASFVFLMATIHRHLIFHLPFSRLGRLSIPFLPLLLLLLSACVDLFTSRCTHKYEWDKTSICWCCAVAAALVSNQSPAPSLPSALISQTSENDCIRIKYYFSPFFRLLLLFYFDECPQRTPMYIYKIFFFLISRLSKGNQSDRTGRG